MIHSYKILYITRFGNKLKLAYTNQFLLNPFKKDTNITEIITTKALNQDTVSIMV